MLPADGGDRVTRGTKRVKTQDKEYLEYISYC